MRQSKIVYGSISVLAVLLLTLIGMTITSPSRKLAKLQLEQLEHAKAFGACIEGLKPLHEAQERAEKALSQVRLDIDLSLATGEAISPKTRQREKMLEQRLESATSNVERSSKQCATLSPNG